MTSEKMGFLSRLGQAIKLLTGGGEAEGAPAVAGDDAVSTLQARIRGIEMDIEERDARIEKMRKEFEMLRRRAESDRKGAGAAGIESFAKGLAPLVSQAPTMRAMHAEGRDVQAADLLKLLEKIEGTLQEVGIERIGVVGETTSFDMRLHQRMSGGDVREGDRVRVRFVGYRLGDTILLKSLVSREE